MSSSLIRIALRGVVILFSLNLITACFEKSHSGSEPRSVAGSLDKVPSDTKSIEAQLSRYVGQTQFLNVANQMAILAEAAKAPSSDSGGTRQIEEGDLFKVGSPGSKLLYVLNPYRGLQVVDFSKGPDSPRLLGRTEGTANELIEMYFDAPHMTVLVLERRYDARTGAQGILQIYSVKDPSEPRLIQTVDLQGDVADSRVVGEILYVGTSRWVNFQEAGAEGWIQSFNLDAGGVSPVADYRLNLPIQNAGNMNIVENKEGDQVKYYLIATLVQNRFNWRDRKSTIEVVDISDEAGAIRPLLIASAQGEIRERSGSNIQNGSLIAVSNSWSLVNGVQVLRVFVESFALPTKTSKIIDQTEADFRRLWFEKMMKNRPSDQSEDEYAETLGHDPEYGLKGVFVKDGEQTKKLLPDQVLSVGDETGLHASLQDVRWVDDKLYVFWVPANQVDPLDVFDIAAPASELRYLGRTLFDGWIQRAIPFQYKDSDYLLGLGWLANRQAQAMIFKLPAGETQKVETIAQLTLAGQDSFANFNDQDKTIEARIEDDGTGTIIFPVYQWAPSSKSGGKLISFDLNAAKGGVLQEGGLLEADASWLRRVFSNPEIGMMHTLSDRNLGTFDINEQHFGSSDQIFSAVSILELARDIRAYVKTSINKNIYGLQMISQDSMDLGEMATELRVVDESFADTEADRVLASQTLKGRYETHYVDKEGTLFVLTSQFEKMNFTDYDQWEQSYAIHRVRWLGESLTDVNVDTASWKALPQNNWGFVKIGLIYRANPTVISEGPGDSLLVSNGRQLTQVTRGEALVAKDREASLACLPKDAEAPAFHRAGSDLYVSYAVPFTADDVAYNAVHLVRTYMAPLSMDSLQALCASAINIPGRPLRIENGQLISEEDRFLGFEESMPSNEVKNVAGQVNSLGLVAATANNPRWAHTAPALMATQLDGSRSTLQDLYDLGATFSGSLLKDDAIYLLEQANEWSPRFIVRLLFDQGRFARESFVLPPEDNQGLSLIDVLSWDKTPLFLIQNGREASLFRQEAEVLRPQEIQIVQEKGLSKAMTRFPLLEWIEPGIYGQQRMLFEADKGRLTLAQGLYGVQQIQFVRN